MMTETQNALTLASRLALIHSKYSDFVHRFSADPTSVSITIDNATIVPEECEMWIDFEKETVCITVLNGKLDSFYYWCGNKEYYSVLFDKDGQARTSFHFS